MATDCPSSRLRISSNVPKKSAPSRSILLMNAIRGTLYRSAWRHTVSLWASTPSRRAEHHHAAVQHAQAALDLGREIDVAGRVDQVDDHVFPAKGDAGGLDRDAAFLLLGIEVGDSVTPIHVSHAVRGAAVEQHPLGERGLARVDVGNDADIAELESWRAMACSVKGRDGASATRWLRYRKLALRGCGQWQRRYRRKNNAAPGHPPQHGE